MVIKYDKNKFILIMSDNVDRKVCNGLQSTKNSDCYDNIYTTINTLFTHYKAKLILVQSVV